MQPPLVSICIATHNMKHLILQTIRSCNSQDYENKEVIVYDDASTDGTEKLHWEALGARYVRGEINLGVGKAFNEAIKHAKGEYIVLMCADDLFTNRSVILDIVFAFVQRPGCGVITRYYYQFINGDCEKRPVRAWRTNNPIIQANNPSGLAFRREAIKDLELSNKMMIESAYLVSAVLKDLWGHYVIKYDTVAARVHGSTSTQGGYWLKRRVSSPVMDWHRIGGREMLKDYTSLIQIKTGYKIAAVWEEICNFIILRPLNIINPAFWFFSILALITPRRILRKIPHWYRLHIGRQITKEVKRP